MGEIKSTLDLVLEKTKNLKLSSEEKEAQKQKEIENRIKGLLQKFQDGVLEKNQLKIDYKNFKKDSNVSDNNILINEIIQRLDPDQDYQRLLEILQECCKVNTEAIETTINDYRAAYSQAEEGSSNRLKEYLAVKFSVSGSAVVPNLETDEQWRQKARELRAGFADRLTQKKDNLIAEK
ncbi:MAG: hypothetical protein HKO68_14260 [Desulfobacterales bacterium]|nr:hypothetical protein [Desulfobacterales bacterium]